MIRCYTLVDITQTGFTRKPKTPEQITQRNQQRNYETFIQLISLRSQPQLIHAPQQIENINIGDYEFGSYYMPSIFQYNLWIFDFNSDHLDSYATNNNPVGSLTNDFNNIPIISSLSETASIQGVISTQGEHLNTYFQCF